MGALAAFGINNDGVNLTVNLVLLCLVVLWMALVYWTFSDARRRLADPLLVGCATAAALFPFIGTIVYAIVRPPEYLEDARERELEIAAAEARLAQADHLVCPFCSFEIERSFLRCPSCLRRLKEPCRACGRPLDPRWRICPYCESEIDRSGAAPRRRARRAAPAPARRAPAPATRAASAARAPASRSGAAAGGGSPSSGATPPRSSHPARADGASAGGRGDSGLATPDGDSAVVPADAPPAEPTSASPPERPAPVGPERPRPAS